MSNGIKVAVIDDGIHEYYFENVSLHENIEITPQLNIKPGHRDVYCDSYHGTICAAIISQFSEAAVELNSIKILATDRGRGTCDQLVEAIHWCIENDMKVINISLGSTMYQDFHRMGEAINKAYQKGLILIAAGSNKGVFSYPASHSNVIGVQCDRKGILKEGQFIFNNLATADGINIIACANIRLRNFSGEIQEVEICNSFSAPVITSKVCSILHKMPEIRFEEILEILSASAMNAQEKPCNPYEKNTVDWLRRSMVFNLYNKVIKVPKGKFSENVVHIQCDDLEVGLDQVIHILQTITEDFEDIVIIVNDIYTLLCKTYYGVFWDKIEPLKKNMVFLDDYDPVLDLYERMKSQKIKYYNPYQRFRCVRDFEIANQEIQIPVITLIDFEEKELLKIINRLQSLFRQDGYNILSVSDSMLGVLMEVHFLPLKDFGERKELMRGYLKEYMNTFDPDVLLIGINNAKADYRYLQYIKSVVVSDLYILLDCPDWFKEKMSDRHTLFVGNKQVFQNNREPAGGSCKDNNIEQVYHNILALFNAEERPPESLSFCERVD